MNNSMNFGGGGFDQSQNKAAPSSSNTADDKQTIIPLVISQILALEDNQTYWGDSVSMVSLVAVVKNIDHSSTKITYILEDHTGRINAFQWLEEGDATAASIGVMMNTYAHVRGSLRDQQGTKSIMVFKIEPVKSFNEVTTHHLEVLNARFEAERLQNEAASASASMQMDPQHATNNSLGGGNSAAGLDPRQQAVFAAIKSFNFPEGISNKQLLEKFPNLNAMELTKITDYMCFEGLIYTSIDTEHYLSTDID